VYFIKVFLTTNKEKCLPVNDLINLVARVDAKLDLDTLQNAVLRSFSLTRVARCTCHAYASFKLHDQVLMMELKGGSPQTPSDLQLETDWHVLSLSPSHLFPPLQLGPRELENDYLILYDFTNTGLESKVMTQKSKCFFQSHKSKIPRWYLKLRNSCIFLILIC
jgi:hypothetical protein